MLECRLNPAATLKKLLGNEDFDKDAVKDLVTNVNFDCNDTGISLQAMDTAHVSLISLLLRANGFEQYRCDRNINLGLSLASLVKVLKACGSDDVLSLRALEKADSLTLMFESAKQDRVSEYELKLMDVDAEQLSIPEMEYDCTFEMSSSEFRQIVTNMSAISETVTIAVTKEGISFTAEGDIGSGSVTVKSSNESIDEEEEGNGTTIHLRMRVANVENPVAVLLSLKFLCDFAKATPLSKQVRLGITNDVPVLVEYKVSDIGHLRYYLAPKMDEDEA